MHLIQQQFVEVTINNGTPSQALVMQREITDACENELLKAIEKVLESYNNYGDDINIDYLRITVDNLHADNFKQALADAVSAQLKAAITQRVALQNNTSPSLSSDVELIEYKRRKAQVADHRNVEKVFFHFLLTGVHPWWSLPERTKDWENTLLNIFFNPPSYLKEQLVKILHQSPVARQRFTSQFSIAWQREIMKRLSPTLYTQTLYAQQILLSFPLAIPEKTWLHWQLEVIIKAIITPVSLIQLIHAAIVQFVKEDPVTLVKKHVHGQMRDELVELLETNKPEIANNPVINIAEQEEIITDGYYIHNAGLILLSPFITHFLKHCGAADDSGILQDSYAVALLEFLATGRTGVGEEELILNKILCGIPLHQPVEKIMEIDPAHMEEADNLLNMVISNWSSLKSTSPQGLRASFLHRAGKLSVKENDDNWLLQVEHESYDRWLLCDIPWGYNMIALPYTKHKMIWVEWM